MQHRNSNRQSLRARYGSTLFLGENQMKAKRPVDIKSYVYISLMAALICVCSWITIPSMVPFTMQTFAVFCALLLLGGKKGTAAIGLYLFMGLIGLPVFSGFRGGIAHLIGPTGGYIIGFLFSGIIYTLLEPLLSGRKALRWIVLALSQIVCYLIGTLWFITIYGKYSLQGTTQGRYLTGGVPPVRFSM